MKLVYMIKYAIQHVSVFVMALFGLGLGAFETVLDQDLAKHFTKFGDKKQAYKLFLSNNGVSQSHTS